MVENLLNSKKEEFEKVLQHFEHEVRTLRTGRASPGLLSTVKVESYGSIMPIEHVASITVQDAKTLLISPWDKSMLGSIEKGIIQANLNLNPSNDGSSIRINVPPLNEERRREFIKLLGTLAENTRIGIRQVREDILKAIKKAKEDGDIGEDDVTRGQKKLQDLVDKYNDIIKEAQVTKEKELMTV